MFVGPGALEVGTGEEEFWDAENGERAGKRYGGEGKGCSRIK